jgi:hypothetical protein
MSNGAESLNLSALRAALIEFADGLRDHRASASDSGT